jgi:chromosome segregation ATPase
MSATMAPAKAVAASAEPEAFTDKEAFKQAVDAGVTRVLAAHGRWTVQTKSLAAASAELVRQRVAASGPLDAAKASLAQVLADLTPPLDAAKHELEIANDKLEAAMYPGRGSAAVKQRQLEYVQADIRNLEVEQVDLQEDIDDWMSEIQDREGWIVNGRFGNQPTDYDKKRWRWEIDAYRNNIREAQSDIGDLRLSVIDKQGVANDLMRDIRYSLSLTNPPSHPEVVAAQTLVDQAALTLRERQSLYDDRTAGARARVAREEKALAAKLAGAQGKVDALTEEVADAKVLLTQERRDFNALASRIGSFRRIGWWFTGFSAGNYVQAKARTLPPDAR